MVTSTIDDNRSSDTGYILITVNHVSSVHFNSHMSHTVVALVAQSAVLLFLSVKQLLRQTLLAIIILIPIIMIIIIIILL